MKKTINYGMLAVTLILSVLIPQLHRESFPAETRELATNTSDGPQLRISPSPRIPKKRLSADELSLSFQISVKDEQVFIRLENHSISSLTFYNSMRLGDCSFPSATWIEVKDERGRPFPLGDGQGLSSEKWTPLALTSRAFLNSELEQQTIRPGQDFCKIVPLKNFFGGTNFDFDTQNFRAKVSSRLYLDTDLTEYIEAESEWFSIPQELRDVPPPVNC